MTHAIWPLFDLRVVTPRLELRYVDDELGAELAALAARGVHDPAFMPFGLPWTDVDPPQQQRNTMQYYWRMRAELSPAAWTLDLAVIVDATVVGVTGVMTRDFAVLRQFETGSWLGREYHGRGFGKELRIATLQLGFDGFDAAWATTGAFADNGPSLGVTGSLGYSPNGHKPMVRRGERSELRAFVMGREHWAAHVRRDDITLHGVDACRPLLGLDGPDDQTADPAVQ